jgi:hypothetical protein
MVEDVLLDQLRTWDHVVVEKEDQFSGGSADAGVPGYRRTRIWLRNQYQRVRHRQADYDRLGVIDGPVGYDHDLESLAVHGLLS